ncbi:MAG: 2,3-bisphosphoglycerate-independent phosphoglycerate mutase [Oscillospiraceae bacterium]|nr:2,3-bisphosphoglycerate-independent phosphoglycerate mutase [Oscillospiraceae bacterium]
MKKPLALIILDGYGENPNDYGNAIKAAKTPNLDRFFDEYPNTQIGASGMDVGLPEGQMGNSEVGHTNIGAGRIVYQELTRITKSIADGDFFSNETLNAAMDHCVKHGTALHLAGLLSDGGVHSHNTHLYAILELAGKKGVRDVFVHCLMDGRDVPPTSGKDYIRELHEKLREIGTGKIATIIGRYYAMDRDNRWDRVERAYNAIVHGEGDIDADVLGVMQKSYDNGITDEFTVPTVCIQGVGVKENDAIIFFNFRPDRAREITRTFVDPDFDGFKRKSYFPLHYVCMTLYDAAMPNVYVAFTPVKLSNTFGEYIAAKGLKQLRIAETEKYAHVTFFFNGGVEAPYDGEDRALIPSPKVATYDLKPEMSAYEVTDELLKRLDGGKYDVIICNYANCDMVGHTGDFAAAVKAVEAVDECLGKIAAKITEMGGVMLVTADHGNADQMYEPDGSPFTAHTTNPAPLIVIGAGDVKLLPDGEGCLAGLAPTMLKLLGLPQPREMTGTPIINVL